jgi:hypothetical protein
MDVAPNNMNVFIHELKTKRCVTLLNLIKCVADLIHASDGVFNLEKYKLFIATAAFISSLVGLHFVWKKQKPSE